MRLFNIIFKIAMIKIKAFFYRFFYGINEKNEMGFSMIPEFGKGENYDVLNKGGIIDIVHHPYPDNYIYPYNYKYGTIRLIPYKANHGIMVEYINEKGEMKSRGICDYSFFINQLNGTGTTNIGMGRIEGLNTNVVQNSQQNVSVNLPVGGTFENFTIPVSQEIIDRINNSSPVGMSSRWESGTITSNGGYGAQVLSSDFVLDPFGVDSVDSVDNSNKKLKSKRKKRKLKPKINIEQVKDNNVNSIGGLEV